VDVWVHHREHQGERIVSPGVNVQEDLVTHTVRRPSDRRSPATSWWMRPQQALHRFEKRFFPSLRSYVTQVAPKSRGSITSLTGD
jgi:hypothetical protein